MDKKRDYLPSLIRELYENAPWIEQRICTKQCSLLAEGTGLHNSAKSTEWLAATDY